MDLQKTAREIGLFETAINLAKVSDSIEVVRRARASMPLPDNDAEARTRQAAKWLIALRKNRYMFLTPEIALVSEMLDLADGSVDFIFSVPQDMDEDTKERLKSNLPQRTIMREEPDYPEIVPSNSMMVVCGYLGRGRAMVFPETYRMAKHYSEFRGKKAFVPYKELETAARYDGWIELDCQRISTVWRYEQ